MFDRLRGWCRASPDACLLALYAVLVALFYAPVLSGRLTFYFNDTFSYYFPARATLFGAFRAGRLCLWTPLIGAGYPLLAEGQGGGLYPGNVLAAILPSDTLALGWTVALHAWLAAALMHGYLRSVGVRPGAVSLGAIAYGFGGSFVGHLVYVSMALTYVWLPGICWGIERGCRDRSLRGFAWAGVALAMALLAVHMQLAVYFALMGLAYGGLRLLATPGRRGMVLLGLGLMLAVAAVLSAAQWLPMLELASQSSRTAVSRAFLQKYSLTPKWIVYLFAPQYFGHPTPGGGQWGGLTVPWELDAYLGIAATVPAILAPVLSRRRLVLGLAALWWGAFLLAWGQWLPFYGWLHSLPVLDSFRIPARWLLPGTFAGAALASLAVDAVLRGDEGVRRRLRHAVRLGLAVLILLFPFLWLPLSVQQGLDRAAVVNAWLALGWMAGCWILALILLCRERAGWRLALLLAVDLFLTHFTYNPLAPPSVFDPAGDPATVRARASLAPEERILFPPYTPRPRFFAPVANLLAGVPGVANWLPLTLRRVEELVRSWEHHADWVPAPDGRARWLGAARVALLELDHGAGEERLRLLRELRVRLTLPRYGPVGAAAGADGMYRVEGELAPVARIGGEGVPWRRWSGARETVGPAGPGILTVSSVACPGWEAFGAAGRRLPVGCAEGLFRAVRLTQPEARVTMVFAPATFRVGLFLSLLGLAGVVAAGRRR
ncbi:MAG: hypothetical protein HYU66_23960 [Armatimonadetes bacterium]|nr:hypothetical protein [Armatimonadota bacterium]